MKTCGTCKLELPVSEFHKRAKSKDGLCASCKACAVARAVQHKREKGRTPLPPLEDRIEAVIAADRSAVARFWRQVSETPTCWLWNGPRSPEGYGTFSYRGRNAGAHRVAFWLMRGRIAPGLHLDHLCRNTSCVNPSHLEAVSPRTNVLRGLGRSAENARKTHCPQGHPYDELNTVIYNGRRRCKTCRRERAA